MDDNVQLTSSQRKVLKGLGHRLDPVVYIGKEGLSPTVVKAAESAIKVHELIKIKAGQNSPLDRNVAGRELGRIIGAEVIQVIGRMTLLYRANTELPEDKRIRI